MKDRDIIDAVVDGTFPKIKDIRDAVSAKADAQLQEQIDRGDWPELLGEKVGPAPPAREEELSKMVWTTPLYDAVIQFLWAILSKATDGEFVVDEASVAAASATIDEADIVSATGFDAAHVRPILDKMIETFLEVIRAHGTVEVLIDRKPVRLVART